MHHVHADEVALGFERAMTLSQATVGAYALSPTAGVFGWHRNAALLHDMCSPVSYRLDTLLLRGVLVGGNATLDLP